MAFVLVLILKKGRGFLEPASSVEKNFFARNLDLHAEGTVSLEVFDDFIGEVVDIDDYFLNSNRAQSRQRDLQKRAPGDFHQRFRTVIRERAQPCAQAGSKNHRPHRLLLARLFLMKDQILQWMACSAASLAA